MRVDYANKDSLKTRLSVFQAAYLCFCLNNRAYFANASQRLLQPQQVFFLPVSPVFKLPLLANKSELVNKIPHKLMMQTKAA